MFALHGSIVPAGCRVVADRLAQKGTRQHFVNLASPIDGRHDLWCSTTQRVLGQMILRPLLCELASAMMYWGWGWLDFECQKCAVGGVDGTEQAF